ncbi:Putative surface protein bspA-like (TvBspA-like-625) [Durusdinium trenchii]
MAMRIRVKRLNGAVDEVEVLPDTSICDFKQKLKDMQQYEDEMTRQLTIVDVVCDVQKLDDDQKTLVESGIEDGAEVQVLFRSMEPVECSHRFSYGQRPVQVPFVKIPSTVHQVERFAFENCRALLKVEIPDSVTSIETWAFKDCTALRGLTLPSSVT